MNKDREKRVEFWKNILKDEKLKGLEKIVKYFENPRQIQARVKFVVAEDWNDGGGDSIYECDDIFALKTPDGQENIVIPWVKEIEHAFMLDKPKDEYAAEVYSELKDLYIKKHTEFEDAYKLRAKATYYFENAVFAGGGWANIRLPEHKQDLYTWQEEFTLPDKHTQSGRIDKFITNTSYKFLFKVEDIRGMLVPEGKEYWTESELKDFVREMTIDIEAARRLVKDEEDNKKKQKKNIKL